MKRLLMTLFWVAGVSLTFPALSLANLIIVDSTDQETLFTDNGTCTLGKAIRAANTDTAVDHCNAGDGPDTIVLLGSEYDFSLAVSQRPDGSNNGLPIITSDITIEGALLGGSTLKQTVLVDNVGFFDVDSGASLTLNNVTLDGGNVGIFRGGEVYIESGAIATFNNDTFQNGFAGRGGGVFIDSNTSVTFNNCDFIHNEANEQGNPDLGKGGAIFNRGMLKINDSNLNVNLGNGSPSFGGGIYNDSTGTVVIENTSFRSNKADSGGGVYNHTDGAVQFISSTLTSNFSVLGGGAIQNDGILSIINSSLTKNFAGNGGGGISNFGTLFVMRDTFEQNNVSENPHITGTAIFNAGGSAVLINSTFSGNNVGTSSPLPPRPTIQHEGGNNIEISNCTFEANNGNAISSINATTYGTHVNVRNSIFSNSAVSNCDLLCDVPGAVATCDPIVSDGYNIDTDGSCGFSANGDQSGIPAGLAPLADNGGPTQTHALLRGSAAIDHGDPEGCEDQHGTPIFGDQRGLPRSVDGDGDGIARCDVGAFEFTLPTCGNFVLDSGESCDDGNTANGDGCSAACQQEAGYLCIDAGLHSCHPTCGNGVLDSGEACDVDNNGNGQGNGGTGGEGGNNGTDNGGETNSASAGNGGCSLALGGGAECLHFGFALFFIPMAILGSSRCRKNERSSPLSTILFRRTWLILRTVPKSFFRRITKTEAPTSG